MLIPGEWLICNDGVARPVVRGEVQGRNGSWLHFDFLLDIGADRTVLFAESVEVLGFSATDSSTGLVGVGGAAPSVEVPTAFRFTTSQGNRVVFRGQFAAVTEPQILEMSLLGRDITDLFAVIVDRPGNVVCMLSQRHQYRIETV